MKQESKSKSKKIYSQVTYWLGVVAVGLAVGLSIQFAVAWQEPTAPAPGGNLEAPINVSDVYQTKKAGLILNSEGGDPTGLVANKGLVATNGDIIVTNGNVGIGTNNPEGKLDVRGGYVAIGNDDDRFRIGVASGQTEYNQLKSLPGPWLFYMTDVSSFDGWVGLRIGNKAGAHLSIGKADGVYAPVYAADFERVSDQRYKKDIKTVENALDRLNNIRGVDFKLRDDDSSSIGVIAQEIEKDFPSLVSENEYSYKMVNYDGFIGVLIEAVKEQQEQIEKLQEEVESLK